MGRGATFNCCLGVETGKSDSNNETKISATTYKTTQQTVQKTASNVYRAVINIGSEENCCSCVTNIIIHCLLSWQLTISKILIAEDIVYRTIKLCVNYLRPIKSQFIILFPHFLLPKCIYNPTYFFIYRVLKKNYFLRRIFVFVVCSSFRVYFTAVVYPFVLDTRSY
jgi:hypothetical protein